MGGQGNPKEMARTKKTNIIPTSTSLSIDDQQQGLLNSYADYDNKIYSITSITNDILNLHWNNPPPLPRDRLLFLSVIYQALLDLTKDPADIRSSSDFKRNYEGAYNWFFLDECFDDLDKVSTLAGVDPYFVRKQAKRILNKAVPFDRKRLNVLINETIVVSTTSDKR